MRLYVLRYLLFLILEGEKTNSELSQDVGGSTSNVSHAMKILHKCGLVKHPEKRPRSWDVIHTNKLILIIEKLLLVSKNNPEIKSLLELPTVIKIGTAIHKKDKGLTIVNIVKAARVSKLSAMKVLDKMTAYNLLRKKTGKPNLYYVPDTILSRLFFDVCCEIGNLLINKKEKEMTSREIIKRLKNDDSVLILIHYGSSARGTVDSLSDIDILAVTRDKISRGNILDCYTHKKVDLHVYSKSGFLQLIKTQPDFIKNISTAKVLKGEDILQAIMQ